MRRVWRILSWTFFVFVLVFVRALVGAQAPTSPGKPLPPGPMQAKVKEACTTCHNSGRITEQHLNRQQWSTELEKMEGLGAVISDSDREGFLKYLTKNFGPQKGSTTKAAESKSGSGPD